MLAVVQVSAHPRSAAHPRLFTHSQPSVRLKGSGRVQVLCCVAGRGRWTCTVFTEIFSVIGHYVLENTRLKSDLHRLSSINNMKS